MTTLLNASILQLFNDHSFVRPESAAESVSSSADSRPPPAGMPRAIRVRLIGLSFKKSTMKFVQADRSVLPPSRAQSAPPSEDPLPAFVAVAQSNSGLQPDIPSFSKRAQPSSNGDSVSCRTSGSNRCK